eukprot:1822887-Lingulodinium_polyedra.AAC.1
MSCEAARRVFVHGGDPGFRAGVLILLVVGSNEMLNAVLVQPTYVVGMGKNLVHKKVVFENLESFVQMK